MDIEKLTKMQIVLLTLLVSFVTSIATGIVTVTLMDQAPPVITQTLSRVVERTIERVVQDDSKQGASIITKETTIVVKEEDLITDSINNNSKSVVRIKKILEDGTTEVLLGLGVIVFRDGIIVTDPSVIEDSSTYIVETANGDVFNAYVVETEGFASLAFLSIDSPDEEKAIFQSVTFSKSDSFKLGQTVLSLTGEERTDVAIGIISGLIEEDVIVETVIEDDEKEASPRLVDLGSKPETIKVLSFIKTSIDEKEVIVGSPLIDIFGEVVGISTKDSFVGKAALFTPINGIRAAISKIVKAQEPTSENKVE